MTTPLVSVVTATRNRPDVLRRALASIQSQTLEPFEAIVVDDGSMAEMQAEYDAIWRELDERFRLVRLTPPDGPGSGPGAGRNHGIELARGEFVAFLDHDDFWVRPDHLSVAADALTTARGDYFFSNLRGERDGPAEFGWAAENAALLGRASPSVDAVVTDVPLERFLAVMRRGMVHPSQMVVRRTLLDAVGGFARELTAAFDVNLMFRLADRATGILYRPDVAVAVSLPDEGSYTTAIGASASRSGLYDALVHAEARCRRRDVRACIRARRGWMLRETARGLLEEGRRSEAVRLQYQALLAFPTVGALFELSGAAFRTLWDSRSNR